MPDNEQQIEDMAQQITKLQQQLDDLSAAFYRNNFSANQDFSKYCNFTSRLKVPHSGANPTVGVVGDIVEVGGKLLICTIASSTAPTWTIVGTQT